MPKVNGIKKYITEFGEQVFSTDCEGLFCKICFVKVNSDKRFTVTQHLKTTKHERLLNRKQNFKTQQLFTPITPSTSSNSKDLFKAMVCANIPLHKITNIEFRSFIEKYTLYDISSESALRKTYVTDCYNETMHNIRKISLMKNLGFYR